MLRHLLLALFLVWAQIGAVAHEASHHHEAGHAPDEPCLQCLAYAPLGAGAISTPLVWSPPQRFPLPSDAAVPAAPVSRFIPTYQSRAPPRA
jgi:hypothetical protein